MIKTLIQFTFEHHKNLHIRFISIHFLLQQILIQDRHYDEGQVRWDSNTWNHLNGTQTND